MRNDTNSGTPFGRSVVPTYSGNKSITPVSILLLLGLACLPLGMVGFVQAEETEKPVINQVDEYLKKSEDEILAEVAKLPDEQIDLGLVSLVIAKGYYPATDINKYLRRLDEMAGEIRQLIGDEEDPEKIIQTMNQYLYETKKMKMSSQTLEEAVKNEYKEVFLNKVLDTGIGNCVGLSTLYLVLAERLGLPIYGVAIPMHVFVRYDDGKFRRNIEITREGKEYSDERIIRLTKKYWGSFNWAREDFAHFGFLENNSKKVFLKRVLLRRAVCNYRKGAKQRTKDDCQKAIILSSNLSDTYWHISRVFTGDLGRKDYDEAIVWMDKAIKLSPDYYLFHLSRGRLYSDKEELEKALRDYDKAIELNNTYSLLCYERGMIHESMKEYNKALVGFDRAIELAPEAFLPHFGRARVLYIKKEYDKALEETETVVKLRPKYARLYALKGLIYNETGEKEKALKAFEKYLTLDPSPSDAMRIRKLMNKIKNKTKK